VIIGKFFSRAGKLVCGGDNSRRVYTARGGALAAYTHQAGRPENQDGFLVLEKRPHLYLAVADGMGGMPGGREASALALKSLQSCLLTGTTLNNALLATNLNVVEASRNDPALAEMGTTLTTAAVSGDRLELSHVGDSRAYLIDGRGDISLLTRDHSSCFETYETFATGFALPQIEPEKVYEFLRNHARSNPIYSYLGQTNTEVYRAEFAFPAGHRLLLASDGLNYLPYRELKAIIWHRLAPSETVGLLMRSVRAAMKPLTDAGKIADNVTVILLENHPK
jgi:serine/threonine protein phosphatase PrpC